MDKDIELVTDSYIRIVNPRGLSILESLIMDRYALRAVKLYAECDESGREQLINFLETRVSITKKKYFKREK